MLCCEACYLLLHGAIELEAGSGERRTLRASGVSGPCMVCGEEGLLRRAPSAARAWTTAPCVVLVLAASSFGKVPWLRQIVALEKKTA